MELLRLFQDRLLASRWLFLSLAAISGLSGAMVLTSVNHAAVSLERPAEMVRALVIFSAVIVTYMVTQKRLMLWATQTAEDVMDGIRRRLVDKIRCAELSDVEQLSPSKIYTLISRETKAVSDAAPLLMISVQSMVMILVIMAYLAYLSQTALSLMVLSTMIGAGIHLQRSKQVHKELHDAIEIENSMAESLSDLLYGFKEVKMSRRRGLAMAEALDGMSGDLAGQKVQTHSLYIQDFVYSQVTFFLMTGVVVFVVPSLGPITDTSLGMITTASLFLIGPVSNVVASVPLFGRANASAESITALERRLESLLPAAAGQAGEPEPFDEDFTALKLTGLTYHYSSVADEPGFRVGPFDLEIPRGKVVFITGGNGSGKSTFIKLLLGLYQAENGTIQVDERVISPSNRAAYRMLFSAIFADNHLFQTLWGHPPVDPEEADQLLAMLEMHKKVSLVDGRFSSISLSSGQKKRLAMVAALLEKKPIYIFDEWAADQDPHFREKFYRQIIPRLKESGKTIIAVTHDDKYFDAADIHLHMDNGLITRLGAASPDSARAVAKPARIGEEPGQAPDQTSPARRAVAAAQTAETVSSAPKRRRRPRNTKHLQEALDKE